MPELLRSEIRTDRKPHTCSLCGAEIKTGEQYGCDTYTFNGEVYDWKTHMECDAVSTFLWDYVDPDEGMTQDEFLEACDDVCRTFICPDCEHFDSEGAEDGDYCRENGTSCIHKLYELSKKYYLSCQRDTQNGWLKWRLVPIKEDKDGTIDFYGKLLRDCAVQGSEVPIRYSLQPETGMGTAQTV